MYVHGYTNAWCAYVYVFIQVDSKGLHLLSSLVDILYLRSSKVVYFETSVFGSQDCEGKIPFYWGTAADKSLAFSDTPELLKSGCGKSFAPFPAGMCGFCVSERHSSESNAVCGFCAWILRGWLHW